MSTKPGSIQSRLHQQVWQQPEVYAQWAEFYRQLPQNEKAMPR
ncbi:hypothetical protein [Yersinia ruckeri]|nr:hypothetical protein [Yersinia ruckeri]